MVRPTLRRRGEGLATCDGRVPAGQRFDAGRWRSGQFPGGCGGRGCRPGGDGRIGGQRVRWGVGGEHIDLEYRQTSMKRVDVTCASGGV